MFRVSETDDELHLTMPAVLESIDAADELLVGFLVRRAIPIDCFAVRIVLREALLNAVIHGSGEMPEQEVELDVLLDVQGLRLSVRDHGAGFAWRRLWESPPAHLDSGRGLPLMRIYASEVQFNEAGNQVTLVRNYTLQEDPLPVPAGEAR